MNKLAAVAMLLASGIATAATLGDRASCVSLADVAADVVDIRDSGVPWDTFEPWIKNALSVARAGDTSYVRTQDDADFVLRWFKRIYDTPGSTHAQFAAELERECLQRGKKA